ncbi:MAG TPA: response regulator [Pseudobacteroides sp.]|uniref:response regulator n=1 Tax=Pseudobacteroides sp. TaxID=1968840 RepID=UPI002F95624F
MIRAILVDDEHVILEELKMMLGDYKNIKVAGAYSDPLEALRELPSTKPDCAFLDIDMAGVTGIELAEKLCQINPHMEVLFVTAYNHYAAQAFDVNAIDYMLKPIRPERLNKAVEKLIMKVKNKSEMQSNVCNIRCFGSFEVSDGSRTIKWSRSKSKELLAYLLQHEGKGLTKYKLCDEQWAAYEPEQALAYLQTSVYALRKSLKEIGCKGINIEYNDDRYILRVKDVDWDVRQFDKAYEIFTQSGTIEAAKNAIQYYRGEYLEGEDWIWSDIVRESYICKFNELQKRLKPLVRI